MNTDSLLVAIRRRWWVVVLAAIIGAVAGALPQPEQVERRIERSFTATHTMLVNNSASLSGGSAVSPNQVSLFATVGVVPDRVADVLGGNESGAQLASQVEVAFDFSTGSLTFTTTQDDAERAEVIADAFAEETNAYLAERQDADYVARVAAADTRLNELENELGSLTNQLASRPDDPALLAQRDAISRQYSQAFEQSEALNASPPVIGFTTLQRAEALETTRETGINAPTTRRTRALMGLAAGVGVGIVAALLLGRLDRKIRTREQAEEILGLRARVSIPKVADDNDGGLVVVTGRHDALSDSYRTLRNLVAFIQSGTTEPDRAPITLVVSPGPGDGKTSAAANLAAAFTETGERTIVVNADFRRPRLGAAVRDPDAAPLPFTVDDVGTVKPRSLLTASQLRGMALLDLTEFEGTAGELSRATAAVVPEMATMAKQVVIDSSPVGATAEVLDMVPHADVIVLVTKVGHTSIDAAARTVAVLRDVSTAPLVLVLTGLKQERAPYYEYTDRRREPDDSPSWSDRLRRRSPAAAAHAERGKDSKSADASVDEPADAQGG